MKRMLLVLIASVWCSLLLSVNGVACAAEFDPAVDVAFTSKVDQTEQRYVLLRPAKIPESGNLDVLIALHGHGSDRWQFAKDGRPECQAARDFALKHGMLYVSPDYRARTSWMGPDAEADVVQIIEELRETQRVQRVFICGGSMGGTGALTFAARRPELVSGVTAMNGTANLLEYGNFLEAISASYRGTKTEIPAEYKARSAEYWPERLTMPLAMTTGGKDTLVPPQSCLRLANVLKLLRRDVFLLHREDGGHSTNHADATEALEFMLSKSRPALSK